MAGTLSLYPFFLNKSCARVPLLRIRYGCSGVVMESTLAMLHCWGELETAVGSHGSRGIKGIQQRILVLFSTADPRSLVAPS